jgi:hypothetical protein
MSNPATDPTPDRWTFEEEVYSFTSDPRKLGAKLLYSVDPTSYKGEFIWRASGLLLTQMKCIGDSAVPAQGDPHPIGK